MSTHVTVYSADTWRIPYPLPISLNPYSRFEPIVTVTTRPDRRELTFGPVGCNNSGFNRRIGSHQSWAISQSEHQKRRRGHYEKTIWADFHRAFSYLLTCKCHVLRIAIKARITIPETQSCSNEAGSRLKKYRRRCGLCGSVWAYKSTMKWSRVLFHRISKACRKWIVSSVLSCTTEQQWPYGTAATIAQDIASCRCQLSARSWTRAYAVYHSVHYSVRLAKNWCRVSYIPTNKNCDFTSGYEQFARYNTLFYNLDSKHIKPNTNSNHKTDLTITLHFNRKLCAISWTSLAAFLVAISLAYLIECCYFVVASGENAFWGVT